MKCLIALAAFASLAVAGRLDSGYIPPHNAAGGYQYSQHGLSSHGPSGGAYNQLNGQQPQQARQYNAPAPQQQYQPQPQAQYQPQPQYRQSGPPIPILEYDNRPNVGDGSYSFRYVI